MAITSLHISGRPGLGATIKAALAGTFRFLVTIAEANPRYKALQRLQAMSDEELAERNLTRERLYEHAFRSAGTF